MFKNLKEFNKHLNKNHILEDNFYHENDENDKLEETNVTFKDELTNLINKYHIESIVDMPDFIISKMLCEIIDTIGSNIKLNNDWHNRYESS